MENVRKIWRSQLAWSETKSQHQLVFRNMYFNVTDKSLRKHACNLLYFLEYTPPASEITHQEISLCLIEARRLTEAGFYFNFMPTDFGQARIH